MTRSVLGDHMRANAQSLVGDMTGALNAARRQVARVDWSTRTPALARAPWTVYIHSALGYGQVMVDAADKRIVIAPSTLDTLSYASDALDAFLTDMTAGASGMKFVTFDAGAYAEAAKAERDARGDNVMRAKDPLTQLEERVRRLLIQAASVNGSERGATANQTRSFFVEMAECAQAFDELTLRLERLQSIQALASQALRGEVPDEPV